MHKIRVGEIGNGGIEREVSEMVVGVITAKDLLLHPISSVEAFGMRKYVRLLIRCLDGKKCFFVDLIWK